MNKDIIANIRSSGLSIYDSVGKSLYIPTKDLEAILQEGLIGLSVANLPIRTRSKVVKSAVCEVLGYPVPSSFKKTQPRFPGQNFDTYIQQAMNVQIWNEEVDPKRRYVLIGVNSDFVVYSVRVITGDQLAKLDHTGTLTHKYQATMQHFGEDKLFAESDTANVAEWANSTNSIPNSLLPTFAPTSTTLLPINEVFNRLKPLVGTRISYLDAAQERNRGAELHAAICKQLGYASYADDGEYPDIVNQLIEVKLQTSPTIDLGLHSPKDGQPVVNADGKTFTSEDIRYVVFDASLDGDKLSLNNLYVVTGEKFTSAFPLFKGKETNAKLQIPLPHDFFGQR